MIYVPYLLLSVAIWSAVILGSIAVLVLTVPTLLQQYRQPRDPPAAPLSFERERLRRNGLIEIHRSTQYRRGRRFQ